MVIKQPLWAQMLLQCFGLIVRQLLDFSILIGVIQRCHIFEWNAEQVCQEHQRLLHLLSNHDEVKSGINVVNGILNALLSRDAIGLNAEIIELLVHAKNVRRLVLSCLDISGNPGKMANKGFFGLELSKNVVKVA